MSPTPWILATQEPWGFLCERCSTRLTIGKAIPVDVYLKANRGFIASHATCEPTPAAREMRKAGAAPLPGFGS